MPRPKLTDEKRLVLQPLRISPRAKRRLVALSSEERRAVIAEMRKAAEMVIIAMTDNSLASSEEKVG
jgi:predicted DNA-binding protein